VSALFQGALTLPEHQREAYLVQHAGDDPALVQEVRQLLRCDNAASADAGLERPPLHRVAGATAAHLADLVRAGSLAEFVGAELDGFTIVSVLGVGGMGAVYEAMQASPPRRVALKLLRLGIGSRSSADRFEVEAAALARLSHPGIAQLYQAGLWRQPGGATPYIAMELVEGGRSITAYARDERLPVRDCVRLFIRVCEAVHHGHQRGVIHRDLKPSNILVDREGRPKVIDFGVARLADTDAGHTLSGGVLGTPAYMSPEQASGDPVADTRSDEYALAVVLFKMLTGRLPHDVEHRSSVAAARAVSDQPAARAGTLRAELRGDLDIVLAKALALQREDRYASVAEFARDLERFLAREPVEAAGPGRLYRAVKFASRHRVGVVVAALVGAVLIGATVTSITFLRRAQAKSTDLEAAVVREGAARRRAERVTRFHRDMIASANPFNAAPPPDSLVVSLNDPWGEWRLNPWGYSGEPGSSATVINLLMAAGRRLEVEFADDDLVFADLAESTGWSLLRVGGDNDPERTGLYLRLLEQAWKVRERGSADDPLTLRAMFMYLRAAQWAPVELRPEPDVRRHALVLLQRCRAALGRDDARTLACERFCISDLMHSIPFKHDDAFAMAGDSVARMSGDDAPSSAEHARHLAFAAHCAAKTGHRVEAVAWARLAVHRLDALAGPPGMVASEGLMHAAAALAICDPDSPDLLVWLDRSIAIASAVLGEQSVPVIDRRVCLGRVLVAQGQLPGAVIQFAQAAGVSTGLRGLQNGAPVEVHELAHALKLLWISDRQDGPVIEASDVVGRAIQAEGYCLTLTAVADGLAACAMAHEGNPQGGLDRVEKALARFEHAPYLVVPEAGVVAHSAKARCLFDLGRTNEAVGELALARRAYARFDRPTEDGDPWMSRALALESVIARQTTP
jgi:hypothetical protein